MNLPDDARPTTFITGTLAVGGSAVTVWSADLLGVITYIGGVTIAATEAFGTIDQNGILVATVSSFGGTIPLPANVIEPVWIPVNPGDVLTWAFTSTDGAATQGLIVAGWQYNLLG